MDLEAWRDQHPLEGPYLKLRRAEAHLATIDEYLQKFEALNPHGVSFHLTADGAWYEARLHATFPPFLDFWTIIGEFCYQVRSSLDQVIYALSVFPDSLSDAERRRAERDTAFPITVVRQDDDSGVKGRLKHIPEEIREQVFEIVDSVQPYQKGERDAALDDTLTLLDELNILDKHRTFKMLPVTIHIDLVNIAPSIRTIDSSKPSHGDVIAWIPANLNPEAEFASRLTAEVVLPVTRHGGYVHLSNLWSIQRRVQTEILPLFKRFFGPLPPSVQI